MRVLCVFCTVYEYKLHVSHMFLQSMFIQGFEIRHILNIQYCECECKKFQK